MSRTLTIDLNCERNYFKIELWKLITSRFRGVSTWIVCLDAKEHPLQCSPCDLTKIFLTSKFSYLLFSTLTHKTKIETANSQEITDITKNKAPRPIIMISWSKAWTSSQIIFITLLLGRCQALQCLSPASAKLAKLACFNLFSSNFNMRGALWGMLYE